MIAINKRIKFTDNDPIFDPAFSKKRALMVQQTDTPIPAISPICD
jgi:hypothetical protein